MRANNIYWLVVYFSRSVTLSWQQTTCFESILQRSLLIIWWKTHFQSSALTFTLIPPNNCSRRRVFPCVTTKKHAATDILLKRIPKFSDVFAVIFFSFSVCFIWKLITKGNWKTSLTAAGKKLSRMKTLPGFLCKLNSVDHFAAVLKRFAFQTHAALNIRLDYIVVSNINLLVTV